MGENRNDAPGIRDILLKMDVAGLISGYPDPAYSALTARLSAEYLLDKDCITIGTGANEIIERISRVYLGSQDHVVIACPTFYRIEDACLRCTAKITRVILSRKNGFRLTWSDMEKILRARNPKIIWICSPNNPTGVVVPRHHIERLAKSRPNTLICVDEAYGEYVTGWNEKHSSVKLLARHKNIIVVRTFSKLLGLAGMTIGYALGSKGLMEPLNHVRLEFPASALAERLAVLALGNKEHAAAEAEKISVERARLEKELDTMRNIEYIRSETSIMLIRHKRIDLHSELLKRNILTADMSNCKGIISQGWVRATLRTESCANDILLKGLMQVNSIG